MENLSRAASPSPVMTANVGSSVEFGASVELALEIGLLLVLVISGGGPPV